MGERQRVAAPLCKEGHLGLAERLDGKLDLDVPELADIEVTSFPTLRPSEEDVAGRLHEPDAVHDALPVVRVPVATVSGSCFFVASQKHMASLRIPS